MSRIRDRGTTSKSKKTQYRNQSEKNQMILKV